MKTPQQDIGNSREARLYQGQALRVRAARTALTETNLPAHPENGKGDGAAGAHPLTSGGAQVLGLIFKELPTNSADEAHIHVRIFDNRVEVQSPGRLPGYMNVDNIYDERFSRNPNVVRILHNLPDPVNHDIGEGLDTAKNELKKAGLVAPVFQEKENAFMVTIRHQKLASVEDVILQYLADNPGASITNKLIRQLSGEDDMQKVKLALQKLRANGEIKLEDENASAFNYRYIKA